MSEDFFTLKELAYKLNVGESTVRFWRDRFNEFIPSVGRGKRRKYRSDALEVLRFIKQQSERRVSAEQIRHGLSRQQPIEGVWEESQRSAQQERNEPAEGQELATHFVDQLLERVQGILQTQNERMAALEAENRELRDRLSRLEEREKTTAPQPQIAAPAQSREAILSYIRQLREQGAGYTSIASKLNREGIPGFRGGMWHSKTIYKLLKKSP